MTKTPEQFLEELTAWSQGLLDHDPSIADLGRALQRVVRERDLLASHCKEYAMALKLVRAEAIKALDSDSLSMRGSSLAYIVGTCRRAIKDAP